MFDEMIGSMRRDVANFLMGVNIKIGVSPEQLQKIKDAVLYAKDLKDRYTVLWLNYKYFKGEFIE